MNAIQEQFDRFRCQLQWVVFRYVVFVGAGIQHYQMGRGQFVHGDGVCQIRCSDPSELEPGVVLVLVLVYKNLHHIAELLLVGCNLA